MRDQVLARSRESKIFLIERSLANEQFEKARPFKPPVTKQLRIERCDHDWIDIELRELTKLSAALFEKMGRVRVGRFFCFGPIVKLFVFFASGDPVIFHAGKFSNAARDWPEMFERQIKSDVAIKFAIRRIAGITFLRAPDLATRIAVARERRGTRRRVTRRIN